METKTLGPVKKTASRIFDLRLFQYYAFGNTFTGSKGDFNFKIVPDTKGNKLTLTIWYGKMCSDIAEPAYVGEYELTQDDFDKMIDHLDTSCEEYFSVQKDGIS